MTETKEAETTKDTGKTHLPHIVQAPALRAQGDSSKALGWLKKGEDLERKSQISTTTKKDTKRTVDMRFIILHHTTEPTALDITTTKAGTEIRHLLTCRRSIVTTLTTLTEPQRTDTNLLTTITKSLTTSTHHQGTANTTKVFQIMASQNRRHNFRKNNHTILLT